MNLRAKIGIISMTLVAFGLAVPSLNAGDRKTLRQFAGTYKKGEIRMVKSQHGADAPLSHGALRYRLRIPVGKGELGGMVFLTDSNQAQPEDEPISGRVTRAVCRNQGRKLIVKGHQVWEVGGPSGHLNGPFRAVITRKGSGKKVLASNTKVSRLNMGGGATTTWTGKVKLTK